jgi:Na+/H+-dicarboxylate symporter
MSSSKSNRLTLFILIGMAAGMALGYGLNGYLAGRTTAEADKFLEPFSIPADIFLRLIKMIVAPLVFTTLVVGVAKQGNLKAVGRIGGKTLLWFVAGSLVSLALGMLLVNVFRPGDGLHWAANEAANINKQPALTLKEFITHIFPTSLFDAMARGEILQVVVFSLFFGVATAALEEKGQVVVRALDAIAHVILKMTAYIMNFAPLAVFGAMTVVIARQGITILATFSKFITEFYIGLLLLLSILLLVTYGFIKKRVFTLLRHIKEPSLIAFSTNSSEAAFPKLLLELERFGCDEKIVSFVLPLGYSFNLAGSMMYMTFASLFLAQAYDVHLDTGTQVTMLLVLMLTSKGVAGVPRSALVVVAGTLATFKIPEAGLAVLLGIDPLMDMGRACMNVVGNSVATAVVCKWEGSLDSVSK